MKSLFDADDDDDEGMFGGAAEDIFAASPPQVKNSNFVCFVSSQ